MNCLHIGKGRQHHAHFNRLKKRHVVFHIIRANLDIGLREESENLRQKVLLNLIQIDGPIFQVLSQRHFFGHPMDLLLLLPKVIGPRIAKRLIGMGRQE